MLPTTLPSDLSPDDDGESDPDSEGPEATATADEGTVIDQVLDRIDEEVTQTVEEQLDLSVESGTVYLRAIQDFSPQLARWVVDGDVVHYTHYNCLGRVMGDGTGDLEQRGSSPESTDYRVNWRSTNPIPWTSSSSRHTYVTYTEYTIGPHGNWADTDTDKVLNDYGRMCRKAGEMVIQFVLR